MQKRISSWVILIAVLAWPLERAGQGFTAQALEPIVYTLKFSAPDTHYAELEVKIPTGDRASIELMMAVWSPGFYRVENYVTRVQDFSARSLDGTALHFEQPEKNRWRIQTGGRPTVLVSYRLLCNGRSVTTNWVANDLAVLNGPAMRVYSVPEPARRGCVYCNCTLPV